MNKVVLDTNIIISAFLTPTGKPAAILRLAIQGDLDLCYNTAILVEYEQVLGRSKFADSVNKKQIERFFEIVYNIGTNIICSPSNTCLHHEADRKFYDLAKAAGAVLITGNKKHYPCESFIQNPTEFFSGSTKHEPL
jgi:putative PIN family toxin of toxin-antitoxin system